MTHAVALVPGFLGFDHALGNSYFADRFIAGVRAHLEARVTSRGVPPVAVVPVPTLPIGSLAERQAMLLEQLAVLDRKLSRPSWHLVGHSTGGLDAALLARTRRLVDGGGHSAFGTAPLAVERLRSVTTIAAPHFGTCLALAPAALLSAGIGRVSARIERIPAALQSLAGIALDLTQRDMLWSRLAFGLNAALEGNSVAFLSHLLFGNRLVRDLDPEVVSALTSSTEWRRSDVAVFSIATRCPPPGPHAPDPLFRDLWRMCASYGGRTVAPPPWSAPARFVCAPAMNAFSQTAVTAEDNDGVVNTQRQVIGTFAALVIGDHGDVIGRYQRTDLLDEKKLTDPGLLTSGASFDDNEFFALCGTVAECIASQI